jgi:acetyl esterase
MVLVTGHPIPKETTMATATTSSTAAVGLEPAAAEFAAATAEPPHLSGLGPEKGRTVVDDVQSGPIATPPVDEQWVTVPGGPAGSVKARIVRPAGVSGALPVIIYIHGAGWVFGNARTHDRLVRELAAGADAAVVFDLPVRVTSRKRA